MGAGASAASMSVEERREMYEVLRETHTRSDLDALAEEEKQAWLEVVEDRADGILAPAPSEATEGEASEIATATATAAATAAAAITSDTQAENGDTSSGSGWGGDGGGGGVGGGGGAGLAGGIEGVGKIRPQRRKSRLSYYQAPGGQTPAPAASTDGQEKEVEGIKISENMSEGEGSTQLPSGELPAWKKTALETETPHELCIGDVVRARDTSCGGMWFEGLLTAISDESTFTVDLTGKGQGGAADRLTVGIDDIVRVMPWFCIEVGDVVECHPKDMMGWVRGKVVRVHHAEALYDVELDGGDSVGSGGGGSDGSTFQEEGRGEGTGKEGATDVGEEESGGDRYVDMELGVTESAIRKIRSGRQSISIPAVAVH